VVVVTELKLGNVEMRELKQPDGRPMDAPRAREQRRLLAPPISTHAALSLATCPQRSPPDQRREGARARFTVELRLLPIACARSPIEALG
jgi:hypothetical protein